MALITYDRLLPEYGISDFRTTLARKMKAKKFPQCIQTSEGRIAWHSHELNEHVAGLPRGHAVNFRAKKER